MKKKALSDKNDDFQEIPIENDCFDDYTEDEFTTLSKVGNRTYLILVIYDVVDNKKRYRVSKTMKGYGQWVQRSAFECHLTLKQYEKMIKDIMSYFNFEHDLLRIYKLTGQAEVKVYGKIEMTENEDLIII
jgi:CRISPR-associated protein Cas2